MAATDTKEHATYSASGAERWLGCPGSIKLSAKAPKQPESKWAKEGTEAHKVLETMLICGQQTVTRNDEMYAHAKTAFTWIKNRQRELDAHLLVEHKVDSSPFTCPDQFGTLDAAIVQEFGTLVVVDYKYGAGIPVDPSGVDGNGNPQLVYYALALSHAYDHNFSDVELVVIQPRAHHEDGPIRTHKMSMEELLQWEHVFKEGVYETKMKDPALIPGKWCRFCPAAVICPALKNQSLKEAQVVFDDQVGLVRAPEPAHLKQQNLGRVLTACDRLEEWIEKVREYAFHQVERGHRVDGWKLVNKRATRRWRDERKAADEAKRIFGAKAFSSPELLTPAQLEKAMGQSSERLSKWLGVHTTNESSGYTLVRDEDKRPAVRPVEDVFSEVPARALPPTKKASVLSGRLPNVKSKRR